MFTHLIQFAQFRLGLNGFKLSRFCSDHVVRGTTGLLGNVGKLQSRQRHTHIRALPYWHMHRLCVSLHSTQASATSMSPLLTFAHTCCTHTPCTLQSNWPVKHLAPMASLHTPTEDTEDIESHACKPPSCAYGMPRQVANTAGAHEFYKSHNSCVQKPL